MSVSAPFAEVLTWPSIYTHNLCSYKKIVKHIKIVKNKKEINTLSDKLACQSLEVEFGIAERPLLNRWQRPCYAGNVGVG
jgi:hypothetical protein